MNSKLKKRRRVYIGSTGEERDGGVQLNSKKQSLQKRSQGVGSVAEFVIVCLFTV